MNDRGRDKGRIDSISDQNLKLQELERERDRFDFWTMVLKEKKAALFELDMKEASSMIAEKIFLFLQN